MLTTTQFQTLDDLYAFYNVRLFSASLPECIINLSRRTGSYGFFASYLWASFDPERSIPEERFHEISLNPDYLLRPSIEYHATLVHEMVHLWQQEYGNPSRSGYHNREWACKMQSIGLMPSDTGLPDGVPIGQTMSQYIIKNGLFQTVYNSIDPDELEILRLKYLPVASLAAYEKNKPPNPKSNTRVKYSCPCGNNIWGRPALQILCLICHTPFQPA